MEHKKIDISIITPFYKGNAYMKQLFECIHKNAANAPGISIELVLVNDSPDYPIQYQSDWVNGFSLQICSNPVNLGIQSSRIKGLQQSKGNFVVFLDQDDLLSDTALQSQFSLSHNADIVVSNGYNENRDRSRPIYHSLAHHTQISSARFYLSVGCLIVSPGQCLIRRSIIPTLWTEHTISNNGADDYFLWLLLLRENIRWVINPEALYTHVDTGKNVSTDLDRMLLSSAEVLDILSQKGLLSEQQVHLAKRRFKMRRLYEGRKKWHKAAACLLFPDLFWELIQYTYLKKCRP